MDVSIKGESAEKFVAELQAKINQTGYNILSKTDLYDYLLYLFNKHNTRHFLDESNYHNAFALRITESRVKAAKLNIALKYKTIEERRESFILFLQRLCGIKIVEKDDCFTFFIDDPCARIELESFLKEKLGMTLDYGENRERVKLEKFAFLYILMEYSNTSETSFVDTLKKELENKEIVIKRKKSTEEFLEWLKDTAKEITSAAAPMLIDYFFMRK
jgi:hypothetical protein